MDDIMTYIENPKGSTKKKKKRKKKKTTKWVTKVARYKVNILIPITFSDTINKQSEIEVKKKKNFRQPASRP